MKKTNKVYSFFSVGGSIKDLLEWSRKNEWYQLIDSKGLDVFK